MQQDEVSHPTSCEGSLHLPITRSLLIASKTLVSGVWHDVSMVEEVEDGHCDYYMHQAE